MSETDKNAGPDIFQYYVCIVAELLCRDDFATEDAPMKQKGSIDEKFRPLGFGSLFRDAAGDGLSASEKARLMVMLRQSVVALTREVDEMMDPVFSMHRLRCLLAPTKSYAKHQDENENRARKRPKVPSSLSSVKDPMNVSPASCCLSDESLCGDCLKQANKPPYYKDTYESVFGSSSGEDKENGEVDDDLQVLLVNRGPKVEEKMEKHSAELSATLKHMEEKVEELLDNVISSCRPMRLPEKHQLRRLIQKLPPKNLDRVVEIIQRRKPPEKRASDEDITVDLQHEDHLTLWRIYFYIKAVENAGKLTLK